MNPFECALSLLRDAAVTQDCANRAQVFGAIWPVLLLLGAGMAAVAAKIGLWSRTWSWVRSQVERVPFRVVRKETMYSPVVYKGPDDAVGFDGTRVKRGQTIELTQAQIARLRASDPRAEVVNVRYRYVGKGNRIGGVPMRDLTEADYAALTPESRAGVDSDPHGMKVYERVKRDSGAMDTERLAQLLAEEKDRSFANAPLLRWQTPELALVDGGMRFLVRCTNEGHEAALVKEVHAQWSTGEPVTQISVKPETTIYAGPNYRVDFVATTAVVFGSAHREVSWSITYADNAGKSYDTDCQAKCYLDTQYQVGEVTAQNLDGGSTPKDRHGRYLARAG